MISSMRSCSETRRASNGAPRWRVFSGAAPRITLRLSAFWSASRQAALRLSGGVSTCVTLSRQHSAGRRSILAGSTGKEPRSSEIRSIAARSTATLSTAPEGMSLAPLRAVAAFSIEYGAAASHRSAETTQLAATARSRRAPASGPRAGRARERAVGNTRRRSPERPRPRLLIRRG